MSIKLVRIDDRLIHGQIVEAWIPYLEVTQIVVADDEISHDPWKKRIAEISTPPDIRVIIEPVAEAVKHLCADFLSATSPATIILFASIEAVYQAIILGLPVKNLNLGNLHYEHGKTQISDSISLNTHEVELLDKINNLGVNIYIQPVPKVPPQEIFACLNNKCICPKHRKT